jgi:hypothetical protein
MNELQVFGIIAAGAYVVYWTIEVIRELNGINLKLQRLIDLYVDNHSDN